MVISFLSRSPFSRGGDNVVVFCVLRFVWCILCMYIQEEERVGCAFYFIPWGLSVRGSDGRILTLRALYWYGMVWYGMV